MTGKSAGITEQGVAGGAVARVKSRDMATTRLLIGPWPPSISFLHLNVPG